MVLLISDDLAGSLHPKASSEIVPFAMGRRMVDTLDYIAFELYELEVFSCLTLCAKSVFGIILYYVRCSSEIRIVLALTLGGWSVS